MSNSREDYRSPKAKITFNKIKKKRKGKFLLIGMGCLCIALVSGTITAVLMTHHIKQVGYYLIQHTNLEDGKNALKFDDTVNRVSKSIVSIIEVKNDEDSVKESNVGVGIVVENGEYIITSYDCVDSGNIIKVKLYSDEIRTVSTIGFDSIYNIAMLKVEGEPLKPIEFPTDASNAKDGDVIISMGNPAGNSFDEGIEVGKILNTRETIIFRNPNTKLAETLKVIKTNIVPRTINTGAALCNLQGQLIGVNSGDMAHYKDFGKTSFYISVDDLEPITSGILDKQDSLISYLGIYGEVAVSKTEDGVEGIYAKDVTKNGIGYDIGIRPTDIIVKLNGVEITTVNEINSKIKQMENGEKLTITVFKNGKYLNYDIFIKK